MSERKSLCIDANKLGLEHRILETEKGKAIHRVLEECAEKGIKVLDLRCS